MTTPNDMLRGVTASFGKAGLAEGTNPSTIKTTIAVSYAINGIAYQKVITDNIAMNALAAQSQLTTCLYAVDIDSAGAITLSKGPEVLTADLAGGVNGIAVLKEPAAVANKARLGVVKVATASATTFTSGTTDLSAAGITASYTDYIGGPVRPFTF